MMNFYHRQWISLVSIGLLLFSSGACSVRQFEAKTGENTLVAPAGNPMAHESVNGQGLDSSLADMNELAITGTSDESVVALPPLPNLDGESFSQVYFPNNNDHNAMATNNNKDSIFTQSMDSDQNGPETTSSVSNSFTGGQEAREPTVNVEKGSQNRGGLVFFGLNSKYGEDALQHRSADSLAAASGHDGITTSNDNADVIGLEAKDILAKGADKADEGDSASLSSEGEIANGILADIYFDFNRASIRADAKPVLEANARVFRTRYPDLSLLIEGHCDERGTEEYNLVLGERRAQATKRYLIDLGIQSTKVETVSYGEEKPSCFVSHSDCWGKNRRSHFVVR